MEYRRADTADVDAVRRLNETWCQAYKENRLEKGFLRNPFTREQIAEMIAAGDVMVATDRSRVVGYYLINSIRETDTIRARQEIIARLVSEGKLPEGRYAYHTQAGIDGDYMRRGVARALLGLLRSEVAPRFDYLIGYIDAANHNGMVAHSRVGWRVFTEYPGGFLAYAPTASGTASEREPTRKETPPEGLEGHRAGTAR